MSLFNSFLKDVGIDLGTANTLVYIKGQGLLLNEPSVAAINAKTSQIVAVGDEAKKMLGRTPAHITVSRPLVSGVISDFDITKEMLKHFLRRASDRISLGFHRGVLGVPNGLTEVERKSVQDAAEQAGCGKVYLVESAVASALGANLPVEEPTTSMIIDIGGGTTDIAVISMGGVVISKTLKIAGDRFNDDIIRFMRDEFRLAIGDATAEFAKITAGSALPLDERLDVPVRGRDIATGLPREVMVKNTHMRAALHKSLRTLTDAVRDVIALTPPELAGDMLRQGIFIAGGGALLRGIDSLMEKETSVKVTSVEDPLSCMVRGLGKIVENFDHYHSLLDNPLKPIEIRI